jgi:type I restriction enzyme S subunit
MFSEVPKHWVVKKLGYLTSLKSGETITADTIEDQGMYPVYGGNGLRGYTDSFTHRGDYVLIGRQGALCGNINYAHGNFWASEHAVVATPLEEYEYRWLGESLRAMNLNQYSVSAAQPGIAIDRINALKIGVPPLQEQRWIADYLDRETTQIDNLIAAKEQMLTLLEEKREALISHAVTRGLDPNVTFKRSGLDWLGDIPQHWNIERAKNLFSVRDERSDSGDEELLSVSHITGVTSRADKQVYMFKAEDMTGYKRCTKGDFVTNTLWGWMGAMGVSPLDGIVSPDYHVYIFKGDLLPEFMELLCRSKPFIAEVVRWSKGVWSSRLRIYPENFYEIRLPVPPKSEQLELIDKVAKEDEKNKELKNALTDSIALLKERRSALITAAVTGQISIQEMSKHSQNEVSQ